MISVPDDYHAAMSYVVHYDISMVSGPSLCIRRTVFGIMNGDDG